MLSYATKQVGHGWGFGIHEALDQIGAILGPLTVAAVLFVRNDPRTGFAILLVPALMAISVLVVAWFLYPRPQDLEPVSMVLETKGFPPYFGTYLAGVALVAAGFVDFALVSFDFQQVHTVPLDYIPVLYAVAMGVDAIAALVFGRLFDRAGVAVFTVAVLISSLFAPLVFLGNSVAVAILGVAVWGIGMGAQESSMRAAVASMVWGAAAAPPTASSTRALAFSGSRGAPLWESCMISLCPPSWFFPSWLNSSSSLCSS